MSAWNDPGKLESAGAAVVTALALSTVTGEDTAPVVRTGQDDDDLKLPSVTCAVVGGGDEVVKGTGIMRSQLRVAVVSSATIAVADHRTRAATVFDAFINDAIKATLSAAVSDFFVYEVNFQAPEPTRKEQIAGVENEFVFVSELMLDVVWCGSDIA